MFLVSGGGEKPEIVRKALREPAANLPCQKVQPINGKLMWYLDNAAGSKL
jgi:6-phosphogluconolactonase/glucosamine-6-phosphate isomerase/deaminase